MTCTTVSCTVCAEAPGYTTLMEIAGGATFGYWLIGSLSMDRAPASITTMASTQAKIGRSMKNRDIDALLSLRDRFRRTASQCERWSPAGRRSDCPAAGAAAPRLRRGHRPDGPPRTQYRRP